MPVGLPEDEELLDDDELLLDELLLDDELLEDELFEEELVELEDELELLDEDEVSDGGGLPPHPPANNATAHKGKSILFIEITKIL